MRSLSLTLLALLSLAASDVFAWGNVGHQTVGAMADQLIAGTHAETKVKSILKSGETLEKVSIWADCAKGYCGPLTPEMRDFVSANPDHHEYHYTDVPFEKNTYEAGKIGTTDHDVVQILKQCIAVLKGSTGTNANPHNFTKRQALLLMAHFIGDIHQPLHVGTAYIDADDAFVIPQNQSDIDDGTVFETRGDNNLLIGSRALHSYWDGQAVTYAMRRAQATSPSDFAAYLISHQTGIQSTAGAAADWPAAWATDTLAASQKAHRNLDLGEAEEVDDRNGNTHFVWPVTTPSNYAKTASTVATAQLTKAGYRFAALLKEIWP